MTDDEKQKKDGEEQAEAEETPTAEEKPKRARKPRKKAETKAEADPEKQKQQEAEEEAEAEAAEADPDAEPPAEDEKARPKGSRRRGSEVASGRKASPARRSPDGDVTVRAKARYVRTAPRKARLVIDHIRGKSVDDARAILIHTPRAASRDVLKLLDSAVANAENNHELVADELKVGRAYVDEGPTIKRYRPRALGRATRIAKRTSHMTIELVAKD